MLQLLQPIWLYSIAGIAIPIIIHLWDVRGGKKLQVGSIMLIEESARLQGRSLRLTDILLLILRCLLIIALAFILAKPLFKKQLTVKEEKGWLMVSRQDLKKAYDLFGPKMDSLVKAGYQFHYFDKGFAEEELSDAVANADSLSREEDRDHWSMLKQLNEVVPPDLPILLFASNSLNSFNGRRPEVAMDLSLHLFRTIDTIKKLPIIGYETNDDSVFVITANSSTEQVSFESEVLSKAGNDKYQLNNSRLINTSSGGDQQVFIDTSTTEVIIFSDNYVTDATYLKAAIEAIQSFTRKRLSVTVVTKVEDLKPVADWLFWLSDKPVPDLTAARQIFTYATGKLQTTNTWIREANYKKVGETPIGMSQRIQIENRDLRPNVIWRDGFGNALLTQQTKDSALLYIFYSRFNPAWTELPWNPQFAEILFRLIIPQANIHDDVDTRIISDLQAQPLFVIDAKAFDKEKFVERTDLSKYVWCLAFLLFATERFLSLKTKRKYA